jgi:undecaprenol kinase
MAVLPSSRVSEHQKQAPVLTGIPARSWREKSRGALRGLRLGIRSQPRFFLHFFLSAFLIAAGMVFRCQALEWCLLVLGIGMVLVAELFHSAVQALYFSLRESARPSNRACLDIGSGAVLLASCLAALLAAIVFLRRLSDLLS